eukprot:3249457-Rhodomonas_salina.1
MEHAKKVQELNQYHRAKAEVSKQESAKRKIGASLWDRDRPESKNKKMRLGVLGANPIAVLKRKGSEPNEEGTENTIASQSSASGAADQKPPPARYLSTCPPSRYALLGTEASCVIPSEAGADQKQQPSPAPQGLGLLAGYGSESDEDED